MAAAAAAEAWASWAAAASWRQVEAGALEAPSTMPKLLPMAPMEMLLLLAA